MADDPDFGALTETSELLVLAVLLALTCVCGGLWWLIQRACGS